MIYVDTSVMVPLLAPEPMTAAVQQWFAGLGEAPVSGDWLLTEFSSAISIKVRRGDLTAGQAKAIRLRCDQLSSSGLRIVPVSRSAYRDAAKLAEQHAHGLRAGDALHLALAMELGAKSIATLDDVMTANAKRLKLTIEKI